MRRCPSIPAAALVVLCLSGMALGGYTWGRRHVAEVTGGRVTQGIACTRCHLEPSTGTTWDDRGPLYPSPVALACDGGGERLYVTAAGTDEVVVLDVQGLTVSARFHVGSEPHGVALGPDGSTLFVSLRGEDRVVALDASNGRPLGSASVGRRPAGLALSGDGALLVVANSGSDDVSLIDPSTMEERRRLVAGREPFAVACDPNRGRAYVANRLSGVADPREVHHAELTVIDLERERVAVRHRLHSAHLSEGISVSGADGTALVPLVRVRNTLPITQVGQGWVMTSGVGLLSGGDGPLLQFPLDEVNAYFADPSDVVIDASGGRAYVASGGADCVTVVDLERIQDLASGAAGPDPFGDHLGISSEYVLARIPTGSNPRGLLLSPDGSRLFVAEHLADAVAVVDTQRLEVVGRVSLGGPDSTDAERMGEIVFHRAAITFQGQFSCRSCHPEGRVDGLTYDFAIDGIGRNLLDNRSLLGIADTPPFKWNGKNRDLHEQCGPRFAKVLTLADPFAPEDLDALVAFIRSLPPPDPDLGPSEAVERGRAIFARTRTADGEEIPLAKRCTTCHPPPLYTNRLLSSVRTQAPTDSSDAFDTPHLLGIGHSAPYLHDGRALTLEEIWTLHSPNDTHGVANDLSKFQLNDLVEFLRSL